MAIYAIGDIQGCFAALEALLKKINFNSSHDKLWFTGDLINRGPKSLETLRFVKSLGSQQQIVLGNHDLHLLAVAHGQHSGWKEDTLQDILEASDREELINWLRYQPLFYHDTDLNYSLVHAGLAPQWTIEKALQLSKEVETILQGSHATDFFQHMYGNEPLLWSDTLTGWDRLRCITNYFTRVRFCHPNGQLELKTKGKENKEDQLIPWYQLPNRVTIHNKIIFGHWAALGGVTDTPRVYALDTGCVWGFCLTAMRLDDEARFSVDCV